MLKQEYSFGKDLEIIKAERLRKNRTNVCNLTKTSKIKIYCKKRYVLFKIFREFFFEIFQVTKFELSFK